MKEYKPYKSGKVREVYDAGDSIIMVATDRISAFDHILKNRITHKGAVLTQMSKFWFDFTSDILPNHMISVNTDDMPEFFRTEEFKGKSMKCRKLTMLPLECIVRGYITGSGWASYQKNGTVCGIKLPDGLQESQQLPEPIFTPSKKPFPVKAVNMPKRFGTTQSPCIKNVQTTLVLAALSLPIRSLNSVLMTQAG